MNDLQRRVKNLITSSSLFREKSPVIIAVSGGADSISLLHLISILFPNTKRIAVYVNHGLRPLETEAEEELVQGQAQACSAHFESLTIDVRGEQQSKSCSLEEAARTLRYQALETVRISHGASAIAVGHTADDQAEEILLRLIRGCGSRGLSGMDLQNGYIVRPLLHETKGTLLSYLKEQNIPHCQDSSNLEQRFLRNRIRLDLLPRLEKKYNRSVRQTLLQTAAILKDEDNLLEKLTSRAYQKLTSQKQGLLSLSLPGFLREPKAIQRRILDKICWNMESKPSYKKIESLLAVAVSQNRKEIHLSSGLRAIREDQVLLFHRPSLQDGYRGPAVIEKSFAPFAVYGPGKYPIDELGRSLLVRKLHFSSELLEIPGIQCIDADTVDFPLFVRHAHEGEWFHPLGAPGKKKISRFFSDHKIPAMDRDQYPLILSGEKVVAIAGLRIGHDYRITEKTNHVLMLQWLTSQTVC